MLWLDLYMPCLPLQARAGAVPPDVPAAVTAGSRVVVRNRAAARCGVVPGMRLAAACALAPGLLALPRDLAAERALLERVAAWGLQFGPTVSLDAPPGHVLVEIGGSLALHGGLEPLLGRVREGASALGHRFHLGVAPVPAAAEALARLGGTEPVLAHEDLAVRLAPLPLRCLGLPAQAEAALRGLGVRDLAGCLRLPRAGLARRIGPGAVRHLDRLLGRAPDPRAPYRPPPRYRGTAELPAEAADAEALRFPLRRLLHELCGMLRGLGLGVRALTLTLAHPPSSPPTRVRMGLAAPGRDPARIEGLLQERLHRLRLPAPVRTVTLEASALEPLPQHTGDLLAPARRSSLPRTVLLDRLAARLGPGAVRRLAAAEDHRPERAWRTLPPDVAPQESARLPAAPRPLWLLPRPEPLPSGADGLPRDWRLHAGPERIESGWWDGGDVARDYHLAEGATGRRGWLFRDRRDGGWYLHGLFG